MVDPLDERPRHALVFPDGTLTVLAIDTTLQEAIAERTALRDHGEAEVRICCVAIKPLVEEPVPEPALTEAAQ